MSRKRTGRFKSRCKVSGCKKLVTADNLGFCKFHICRCDSGDCKIHPREDKTKTRKKEV